MGYSTGSLKRYEKRSSMSLAKSSLCYRIVLSAMYTDEQEGSSIVFFVILNALW